ncbi:MAG: DUF6377 domain-containing protein [Janthinobacterium lividum]
MKLSLFFWLILSAVTAKAQGVRTDKLLQELTLTLESKDTYFKRRVQRITTLTKQFHTPRLDNQSKFRIVSHIYQEYRSFKYDSAFVYAQRLLKLATKIQDPEKIESAKLDLAFIQVSSGMFKEAFELLKSVNATPLDSASKVELYFTKARAYSDLADFNSNPYYLSLYTAKAIACSDTALRYCRDGSYQALTVQGFQFLKVKNLKASELVYKRILDLPDLPLHQLAISASTAAYVAELQGKTEAEFQLLTQAATADVESATTETLALFKLSELCYHRGDLKHAYLFIKNAREDAAFYNARLRQIQIGGIFSVIESQRVGIIERQRRTLEVYAIATTMLALLIIVFAAVILRQLRRLERAKTTITAINETLQLNNENLNLLNKQLHEVNYRVNEANIIKDEYIGHYFIVISDYIDRLEGVKDALNKSLADRHYITTQRVVDGINTKKERNDLFKSFDTVFLKLFPHFVADFNTLLKIEERIKLAEDQLLSAELRIFALIRLGIDNSERISKILGYTVNTVYTYKTRTKKKSLYPNEPSEEFEKRVRAIQGTEMV